jgi:hypothetical protein
MRTLLFAVGLLLVLVAQAVAAPVVSPSTGLLTTTVVASATIDAKGTILRQDGNWIGSVTWDVFADFNITLSAGVFSSPPNCVATLANNGVGSFGLINVYSVSTTQIAGATLALSPTFSSATNTATLTYNVQPLPFNIICEGSSDSILMIPLPPGGFRFPGATAP